ncbi:PREDICTED: uncharacterized protein LOC108549314 [Eufriesea mexicana]|uniref:uncharacterized protein LOC108549314 n=1 Tax=Eufriesea mexicana TaxID=516756 RepID=UPI00083BE222|nr:PREDICTED: uncharacterized protein LOC108549314 [Eufriesea mexicana]
MAIFHDRFECLRVENRALLLSKTVKDETIETKRSTERTMKIFFSRQAIPGQSLVNDCIRALVQSKWNPIEEDDRHTIQSRFAGSVYQQEIEENVLEFLQFCEEDIPVYCTPGKLREFYAHIEDSPLYKDL